MTNRLSISETQFNEFYPDLEGYYNFFNDDPPAGLSNQEFERLYLSNKLWRLNNIYTVINKAGNPVVFRMNYAQHKVYAASRVHSRVIILKSRQQGISTFWLVSYFDDSLFCGYLNVGLMAQGKDEASTLLDRTKILWDKLNPNVKNFAKIALAKDNTTEYSFTNKSTMFIRVSFRSATLQRLHISEFGKIANASPKRAREVKTGTLQALAKGMTGVIESTAEGNNDFKVMWDSAVLALYSGEMSPKDFYPVFLSWLDDPDCLLDIEQSEDEEATKYFEELEKASKRVITKEQRNFWIAQRRELGGDIKQEYPGTPEEAFTASRDGTFYSRQFNEQCVRQGKVYSGVYDPNLPVYVYQDLGVDDYTVLAFVQWYRGEWRVIDEYFNDGYAIKHYLDYIEESQYDVRSIIFPHDISVREAGSHKSNGKAKSRREIVQEYKTKCNCSWNIVVAKKDGVADGIEAVRRVIPNMVVDSKCTYLISCLNKYTKEWDDKLQAWKTTPLHDVYSHGADCLRVMATNTIESEGYNASSKAPRTPRAPQSKYY